MKVRWKITNSCIENYLRIKIDYLKTKDLHINDNDSHSDIRFKDMDYGKLLAYEDILERINNLKEGVE